MPEPIDPEAFREFEHTGWQRAARGYHDNFAKLTTQAIEPLLDAVNVAAGIRVLDVATGGGYAAAAAAERGAVVTGVDFSSVQVAMAREQYPGIEFQEGDAETLSFDDQSFDAVTINFGMLHFPQPECAVAEANRVLRAGGVGLVLQYGPRLRTPRVSISSCVRSKSMVIRTYRYRRGHRFSGLVTRMNVDGY